MALVPYIGITDFMNREQVEAMLAVFGAHLTGGRRRRLHVGVMMSQKTLNGLPTKWADAYPPKEAIADIFSARDPLLMRCLHYADYTAVDFWHNLSKALYWGGRGMDALQLDMVWPAPDTIAGVICDAKRSASLEVILQINAVAMAQVGDYPRRVVERLRAYEGVIDHVLLDKSMGRGVPLSTTELLPFIRAIANAFPGLGLTVAGGLGPYTMGSIAPIVREFPHVSIDAQGRLRPSGDAHDPVDWRLAEQYLVEALQLLP